MVNQPLPNRLMALVSLIQSVAGLDENQAKTNVYYATATHGLPQLQIFPVGSMYGPPGTGKSTLLAIDEQITYSPDVIDGKVSKAVLRDSLKPDTTALIEEADDLKEKWLFNRYARRTAKTTVKRQLPDGTWRNEKLNVFGATVLHRRRPFKDPALHSRSITIRTRKASGVMPFDRNDFRPYAGDVSAIAKQVPWSTLGVSSGDRIRDTWAPLVAVAVQLGDLNWLVHATEQMELARKQLDTGREEEPSEAVFRALVSNGVEDISGKLLIHSRVPIAVITKQYWLHRKDWQRAAARATRIHGIHLLRSLKNSQRVRRSTVTIILPSLLPRPCAGRARRQ